MRWTTLTDDHLKAAGHGSIVDNARTLAVGGLDPVVESIADAVARVRRAVAAGNVLDADPETIPASLKSLTIRLALFALMERIGLPLSDDQRDTKRNDTSDLNRITDSRLRVEAPDTPAATGEMQAVGRQIDAINVPVRLTGRERTRGL